MTNPAVPGYTAEQGWSQNPPACTEHQKYFAMQNHVNILLQSIALRQKVGERVRFSADQGFLGNLLKVFSIKPSSPTFVRCPIVIVSQNRRHHERTAPLGSKHESMLTQILTQTHAAVGQIATFVKDVALAVILRIDLSR
jgi:hypothetical protein